MKEIISTNVLVEKKFTMKKMLEIYQTCKQYNGSVFFHSNLKTVDASNLPKLVSFLLTVKSNNTIKIIVEGEDADKFSNRIEKICITSSAPASSKKRVIQTSKTVQI